MSSPSKKRESKSTKSKNQNQKSYHQKSDYNSSNYLKQRQDKQAASNHSLVYNQNGKKFPKSPFLKKPKRLINEELFPPDFSQQIPTQYIKKEPLSYRFTHKKGRSMDIQCEKNGMRFIQNEAKDYQEKLQNKKVIITDELIDYLKCRNSQSEMKDYQEFNKCYMKSKQIPRSNVVRPKASNTLQIKPSKKGKKSKKKFSIESDEIKRTKKYSLTSRESHKIPLQMNSGEILKNEFRSMDLIGYPRCKSSLRDKKTRRNSAQLHNNHLSLPFPSKLNSLYSNTTSVFCSKAQLEPLINFHSYRIPSQEPENEIFEIRKFQSEALSTSNKFQEKYIEKSPIKQLTDQMFSFSQRTQDIIRAYLKTSFNQQPCIKSESLIIQQGKSFEGQLSGLLSSNQNLPQQLQQFKKVKESHSQSEDKLNTVIKLISQTNSLGQEKKELLLAKIREIIPIAKIGSKEIERQAQNQKQTHNLDDPSVTSQSIKSSFAENQCIQILNIKLLDQTLRERESYLRERLEKELKRLQDRKQMAIQDFQSEKKRLNKWIMSQIKQTSKTRIQLWKGLNFANKLLENKSQKDLKKDQMMKCLSQKIIRHYKLNTVSKPQKIEPKQQLSNRSPLMQLQEPRQIYDLDLYDLSICDQRQQNITQKQQIERLISSNDKQHVQFQSSSDPETNSFRRNFIFTDSAQKIEYDFEDTSPIPESPQEKIKVNQHFLGEMSAEPSEQSSYQQNSARILIQELSPMNQIERLEAVTQQDKEDIFQFIFLDLCLEIHSQNGSRSPIIQKINSFIVKLKEKAKRPRGFKTNPNTIREYLKNFVNFLNKHRSSLTKIHDELQRQMGPTSLQILRYLHPISEKSNQDNQDLQPSVILGIEMFQSFEKEYTDSIEISHYYDDESQDKRRKAFIRNSMHVHNKAIFDAFNEELDRIRPFGQWGRPFQWKKVAKFQHKRTSLHKNKLILQAAEATINFGHYMCGFMIDKEQCNFRENVNISQAEIERIKSNRLKNLLSDYLQELEQKLMFIDDEQVQLLVGIEEFIFDNIIKELINFIIF